MPRGTVEWFNGGRGYGVTSPDGGGEDPFVDHTGIAGGGFEPLDEGDGVSSEATQGQKDMQIDDASRA